MAQEEGPLVLITGAAGSVGSILREHWGSTCAYPACAVPLSTPHRVHLLRTLLPTDRLRLADLAQPRARGAGTDLRATLGPHEELVEFDCADYDGFAAACEGVHTVVHLAADPSPSAEFYESLLPRNIIGAYSKRSGRLCASLLLKLLLLHRRVRGRGRRGVPAHLLRQQHQRHPRLHRQAAGVARRERAGRRPSRDGD